MYIFTISELLLFHLQIKYSMTTYIVVWHLDLDRKLFFKFVCFFAYKITIFKLHFVFPQVIFV